MAKLGQLAQDLLKFFLEFETMVETMPLLESTREERRRWARAFYDRYPYPRHRVGHAIARLGRRGYLQQEHDRVTLTPAGRARVRTLAIDSLVLDTEQPWDGIWRMVIWDIPERRRLQRDRIRNLLRRLQFVRIQKSVWVTPYACREQIEYFREVLGLHEGLIYVEARHIEGARALRQHFHLKSLRSTEPIDS